MTNAIPLRSDYDAATLRALARRSKNSHQARRLLALAAVYEGFNRTDAATMGSMDRQTLRDWVIAFNHHGPDGLLDGKRSGAPMKLTAQQQARVKAIVLKGPDPHKDKIARFRCSDVQAIIAKDFQVELSLASVGRLLRRLGFSHVSARPRHPAQAPDVIDAYKKTSRSLPAKH